MMLSEDGSRLEARTRVKSEMIYGLSQQKKWLRALTGVFLMMILQYLSQRLDFKR